MSSTFFCIDGHTGGNPVRLVAGGCPPLRGQSMGERRQDFLARFDWIRTGLMFEPRGHDLMSGGFILPPTRPDCDAGILFIETSGCLPMCGHGTIGIVTMGLQHGLLHPREAGRLRLEVPAGIVEVHYRQEGNRVTAVRITNVASYVEARTRVGAHDAIVPSIEGSAHIMGLGQIVIDPADPFWQGFQVFQGR